MLVREVDESDIRYAARHLTLVEVYISHNQAC